MTISNALRVGVAVLIMYAIVGAEVRGQETNGQNQPRDTNNVKDTALTTADIKGINHPRSYVSVYELTNQGDTITIYDANGKTEEKESVNHEVDINSKVVVTIDREWIYKNREHANINLSIRAALGQTELEVPGYARVGEQYRLARFSGKALGLLVGLINVNAETDKLLGAIGLTYADTTGVGAVYADSGATAFEGYYDSVVFKSVSKGGDLSLLTSALDKRNAQVHQFITMWKEIGNNISILTEREYSWYVLILAEVTENHPLVITNVAEVIDNEYMPRLKELDAQYKHLVETGLLRDLEDESAKKRAAAQIRQIYQDEVDVIKSIHASIRNLLNELRKWKYVDSERDTGIDLLAKISKQTIALIKDTELLISRTPAKVGDAIDIDIINGAEDSDIEQVLPIRLVVRNFGWQPTLTESFLFFKRLGVSGSDKPIEADSNVTERISATAVNYEPAPGISMIWTNKPRNSRFFRWLQFGFGFNVSFPSFGTTLSNYVFDQQTNEGSVETTSENELGVSVGPIMSFFDGALQLSGGFMLSNVESKRKYFAIGFSFLKGAKGVKAMTE